MDTGTKMCLFVLLYIQSSLQYGFVLDQPVLSQIISLHIWGLSVRQEQLLVCNLDAFMLFWRLGQFTSMHTTGLKSEPRVLRTMQQVLALFISLINCYLKYSAV